jgi:hypothetical protein
MPQRVFVAQHHAETHLLRGLLQSEGIEAEVRREFLHPTMEVSTLIPGMRPEVWILESKDLARALSVVHAFINREGMSAGEHPHWHCLNCGEWHEPQFTNCWRCGVARPDEEQGSRPPL